MRIKIRNQKGTMLLESVIAMLVLCLVILAMIMMADLLIRGRQAATVEYEQAFELNSIRDGLAVAVETTQSADAAALQQIVDDVLDAYPHWQGMLTTLQGRLAIFRLIYCGDLEDHSYEVKLYAP